MVVYRLLGIQGRKEPNSVILSVCVVVTVPGPRAQIDGWGGASGQSLNQPEGEAMRPCPPPSLPMP